MQRLSTAGRSGDEFYAELARMGLHYGPRCRGVRELWRDDDRVIARLARPEGSDSPGSTVHPVLLDAAMHSLVALLADADDPRPLVPAALGRLQVHRSPAASAWVTARVRAGDGDRRTCELTIHDDAGEPLVSLTDLTLQRLAGARVRHDDLLTLAWRELGPATRARGPGRWLLIPDRGGVATRLRALLEAAGDHVDLAPNDRGGHDGVLYLAGLDAAIDPDADGPRAMHAAIDAVDGALRLTQELLRGQERDLPRLWLVTRDACDVVAGDRGEGLAQAPLWGLGLTLAYEHPELRCTRVDLDDDSLAALVAELHADGDEDQLALRGGRRLGARLVPGAVAVDDVTLSFPGPVVITGGLGGLGLELARWLVDRGARHLVLLSRTTTAGSDALAALRAAGARVDAHAVDVADLAALTAIFADLAPVAVFHAAGVLADGLVRDLDRARLERVMTSKIAGAWNLHLLTRDLPLRHFVLYSSVAATIGSPGQANYAAANAFLDALASRRRALGLPALAVAWGSIADVGLAAQDAQRGARLAGRGMLPLAPDRAHAQLARLLADPDVARIAVAPFDPRQWLEFYPGAAASPLFRALRPATRADADALRGRLADATPTERARLVEEFLHAQVLRVLRVDAARMHRRVNLLELGLDSLTGLELRNRLESGLGLALRSTLAWTYPRLDEFAAHLTQLVGEAHAPAPEPQPQSPPDALAQLSDDELMRALAAELAR